MLLLKVFFSPSFANTAINPALGERGAKAAALCPGDGDSGTARLDQAVLGVAEGTVVLQGLLAAGAFCLLPFRGCGLGMERGLCIPLGCSDWSCTAQESPGQGTVTHPVLGVPRAPGKDLDEAQGGGIQARPQLFFHHQTLLFPLHPLTEILAGFVFIPTLLETPGSPRGAQMCLGQALGMVGPLLPLGAGQGVHRRTRQTPAPFR